MDVKFRTGFVNGRPVKTHMQTLAQELAQLGVWVRMHYVYPYPHVDDLMELMNASAVSGYGRVCLIWMCRSNTRIRVCSSHGNAGTNGDKPWRESKHGAVPALI